MLNFVNHLLRLIKCCQMLMVISVQDVLSVTTSFKDGRESVENDLRSGRPLTSSDDAHVTKEIVRSNRRLTVREIAEDCNISVGSCHEILVEKLGMHPVAVKFVPRLMSQDQKDNRVTICQELLDRANYDTSMFTEQIITGYETWVYGYDIETKVQSSQWVGKFSPRAKKARQVRSNVKVLLTVFFFDNLGVIHHEFPTAGQTINRWYYLKY